jgi:hypothetical protein
MNLLDTASLVVTPNGYKASKLYSIVPSDGSGDMTFARTGNTATRVNASGLIEPINANIPRLDYLGSTCPKLLLEPQRTNLLTYSDAFDNAAWTKNALTISANSIASPDGTTNADSVIETATTDYHITGQTKSLTSGTSYTLSFFVKPNGRNFSRILFGADGFGLQYANFNLLTDEIVKSANVTAKIESYSNGWKRCTASASAIASVTDAIYFGPARNTTDGWVTFAGNASLGIYAYGSQLEAGAYATSYIPTTTASVTRNADSCSKTSATALIGQTEGTLYWEGVINKMPIDQTIFGVEKEASSFVIRFGGTGVNLYAQCYNGSSNLFYFEQSVTLEQNIKLAFAYKQGSYAFYINGVLIQSGTNSTAIPACDKIQTNVLWNINSGIQSYSSKTMILWKTRLQNSELATLTSL